MQSAEKCAPGRRETVDGREPFVMVAARLRSTRAPGRGEGVRGVRASGAEQGMKSMEPTLRAPRPRGRG